MGFQQLLDETRGLHAVELTDALAEPFLGEGFDVLFIEVVSSR